MEEVELICWVELVAVELLPPSLLYAGTPAHSSIVTSVHPLPLKISAISGTAVGVHAFSWNSRIFPELGTLVGLERVLAQERRAPLPTSMLSCPIKRRILVQARRDRSKNTHNHSNHQTNKRLSNPPH
jgi:hypothetical protein